MEGGRRLQLDPTGKHVRVSSVRRENPLAGRFAHDDGDGDGDGDDDDDGAALLGGGQGSGQIQRRSSIREMAPNMFDGFDGDDQDCYNMPAVGEGLQQAYQQKKLARPQQKAQQEQQQRQPHRKELEGFDMDGFDLDGFDFDDSDADADEEDASYGRSNQSGPRPLEPTDGATYSTFTGALNGESEADVFNSNPFTEDTEFNGTPDSRLQAAAQDQPAESPYGVVQRFDNGHIEVSTGGDGSRTRTLSRAGRKASTMHTKVEEPLYHELEPDVDVSRPPMAQSPQSTRNPSTRPTTRAELEVGFAGFLNGDAPSADRRTGSPRGARSMKGRGLPAPPGNLNAGRELPAPPSNAAAPDNRPGGRSMSMSSRLSGGQSVGGSAEGRAKIEALRMMQRQTLSSGPELRSAATVRDALVRPRAASVVVRPPGGLVISKPGSMYNSTRTGQLIARAPSTDANAERKSGRGIQRNVGRRGTMAVTAQMPKSRAKSMFKKNDTKRQWGMGLEDGFVGQMDHFTVQDYVLGSMQGDYLVRLSSSSSDMVLCVNDFGSLANYKIIVTDGGNQYEFSQKRFSVLTDVIAFAKHTLKSLIEPGKLLGLNTPATVEPWFVGETDRNSIEKAVKGARQGQFLVRKSTAGDKFVIVVHDLGDVCNYQIDVAPGLGFEFGDQQFDTLRVVIDWFKEQPIRGMHSAQLRINDPVPFDWSNTDSAS